MEVGSHVRVCRYTTKGKEHWHAGNTGIIDEIFRFKEPTRAMIKLDPDLQPAGYIVVDVDCLEEIP